VPPARVLATVLAVGDTGTGTDGQRQVADAMKRRMDAQPVDFIVLLGDNIYPTGVSSATDPLFQTLYEDYYGVWGLPVHIVLGNHDYGGNGAGTEPEKAAFQIAYSANSATWSLPAAYYHFTEGAAGFSVLDTNALRLNTNQADQVAALRGWLSADLGWKIVFGHHPSLSNGPHGNATSDSPLFANFFDAEVLGKVDLYLSGHDHDLQVLEPIGLKPLLVVAGGGGATLTALPGSNSALFQKSTFGFADVAYDLHTLTVTLFDADGLELYHQSLTR